MDLEVIVLYAHNHNDINNNNSTTNTYSNTVKSNTQAETQATPLFGYEPFINFWLRFFDTRRETQFLKVFRNHTMLTTPLTFGISRSPISISQHHGRNSTSAVYLNGREPNCLPTWSKGISQLTLFQNLQILRTIASGHDFFHTPASFPIWGLLWQLWLSYPLHASVKLYPMSVHLN